MLGQCLVGMTGKAAVSSLWPFRRPWPLSSSLLSRNHVGAVITSSGCAWPKLKTHASCQVGVRDVESFPYERVTRGAFCNTRPLKKVYGGVGCGLKNCVPTKCSHDVGGRLPRVSLKWGKRGRAPAVCLHGSAFPFPYRPTAVWGWRTWIRPVAGNCWTVSRDCVPSGQKKVSSNGVVESTGRISLF